MDGVIRFWNLRGEQTAQWQAHQGWVRSLSFSPNGQLLATAGNDGELKLWNLQGQQLAEYEAHQGQVNSLSFSSDGKRIVTGGVPIGE